MMLVSKAWRPQPVVRLPLVATWAAELRAETLAETASLRVSRQDALDQVETERDHFGHANFELDAVLRRVDELVAGIRTLQGENAHLRALSTF